MFELLLANKHKLNDLFKAALEKGDSNKALKIGRKLIKKDNNDYNNLNNVAMVHFRLGFYEHAINYLLKANIVQETACHWENIAQVQQAQKNYQRAIKSYNKALEIEPRKMSAWYLLAQCYKSNKDLKSACSVLTKLILVYPDNIEARIDLGLYLLLQGKVDKGKKHFEWVLSSQDKKNAMEFMLSKLYEYRYKPYIKELIFYYKELTCIEKSLT